MVFVLRKKGKGRYISS